MSYIIRRKDIGSNSHPKARSIESTWVTLASTLANMGIRKYLGHFGLDPSQHGYLIISTKS